MASSSPWPGPADGPSRPGRVSVSLDGTPLGPRIRSLVHPLRDAFAALFFFAFGLVIDPGDVFSVAGVMAAAAVLTVVMNIIAGLIAARLHGHGAEPAGTSPPRWPPGASSR